MRTMVDLVGDFLELDDDQIKTLAEAIVLFGSKDDLGSKFEFYLSTALREEGARQAAFEESLRKAA
jgi:hypothetical protein